MPDSAGGTATARERPDGGLPGPLAQTFAVVGGQAAWGLAVLIAYPTVQVACAAGQPLLVHLVRWVAALVAVAATVTGHRVWRRAGSVASAGDAAGDAPRAQRVAFMGFGGMLLSATAFFLLFVEDLATWRIDPCL